MTAVDEAREALLDTLFGPGPYAVDLRAVTSALLDKFEAAVRAEREGLVAAQRNVIGVAAGLDPAMDERLLRRLVGGLAMAARAALATPPASEPGVRAPSPAPEPKP